MPSYADLLPVLALLAAALQPAPGIETLTIDRPGDLVDLEIDARGTLYLLHAGLPHLAVLPAGGTVTWIDLDPVVLAGGLCLDGIRGGCVSDAVQGRIYRFDGSWLPVDSLDAPGRPGDLCLYGLSVLYVSRTSGTVSAAGGDDPPVLRLDGTGDGSLSASGTVAVYSDGGESFALSPAEAPLRLESGAVWAAAGDSTLSLSGDSLHLRTGPIVVGGEIRPARLSCSPDGRAIALWTPGGGEVLVLR